ncbi:hypothetical protein DL98DRAFT_604731 [Cadophora sp. DSE1049]|nr:hypothetical protein DL98DRAFT_604731 [Cadophora sp. DSE1049]
MGLPLFETPRITYEAYEQQRAEWDREIRYVTCECGHCATYPDSNIAREYPGITAESIPLKHWNKAQCQEWVIVAAVFYCRVSLYHACEIANIVLRSDPWPDVDYKAHILYSFHEQCWTELLGEAGKEIFDFLREVESHSQGAWPDPCLYPSRSTG